MTPEPGLEIADKYRLIRPIASGGMGTIWVAEHLDLGVEVAVKLMSDDVAKSPLGRKRFRREARAAAKLKSPHVTQIHDYGLFEETPYMVMELLEGEDLATYLGRKGRLSLERCAEIVTPICRGLKLAHDQGIVHRDLKPSNVFLSRSGDQEVVKILDFGIAKQTAPEAQIEGTASGVLVGSPRFMSPEQAQGLAVDHRSDIWSLGVVVHTMLTGREPFDGDNLGQLITAICTRERPSATLLAPDLPSAVDALFDQVLDRDPKARLGSVMIVAEAVGALARGEPMTFDEKPASPIESERPVARPRGRDDATQTSDAAVAANASAGTEASADAHLAMAATDVMEKPKAPAAPTDRTSPGVGLDTTDAGAAPPRRMWWMAAGVAVLFGAGAWVLGSGVTAPALTPAAVPTADAPPPAGVTSGTAEPVVIPPAEPPGEAGGEVAKPSPEAVASVPEPTPTQGPRTSPQPKNVPKPRPQPPQPASTSSAAAAAAAPSGSNRFGIVIPD